MGTSARWKDIRPKDGHEKIVPRLGPPTNLRRGGYHQSLKFKSRAAMKIRLRKGWWE